MGDEQLFHRILIISALLVFPFAIYYRVRSQMSGERLDRWQEGPFILFTLRPVGIATMVGLLAYLVNPASMAWASMSLPVPLRWAGVALGLVGGVLLVWTLRNLGKNLTDTVVTRRDHTLVMKGPYRWVRHPFYDAVAMSVVANGLAAANWFILAGGIITIALIVVRTRREEERLVSRFGDAYREYMVRTGRFWPRIG